MLAFTPTSRWELSVECSVEPNLFGTFLREIPMLHKFVLIFVLAVLGSQSVHAQQVNIAIAHPGPISVSVSIPLAIAREQGLFAKYGLEARLVGGSANAVQLIGKEAEFGYVGAPTVLLNSALQGTDFKIFGA